MLLPRDRALAPSMPNFLAWKDGLTGSPIVQPMRTQLSCDFFLQLLSGPTVFATWLQAAQKKESIFTENWI